MPAQRVGDVASSLTDQQRVGTERSTARKGRQRSVLFSSFTNLQPPYHGWDVPVEVQCIVVPVEAHPKHTTNATQVHEECVVHASEVSGECITLRPCGTCWGGMPTGMAPHGLCLGPGWREERDDNVTSVKVWALRSQLWEGVASGNQIGRHWDARIL